jgi:hypothetical protein
MFIEDMSFIVSDATQGVYHHRDIRKDKLPRSCHQLVLLFVYDWTNPPTARLKDLRIYFWRPGIKGTVETALLLILTLHHVAKVRISPSR